MDTTNRVLLAFQFAEEYRKRAHERKVDGTQKARAVRYNKNPRSGPAGPDLADAEERGRVREALAAKAIVPVSDPKRPVAWRTARLWGIPACMRTGVPPEPPAKHAYA
jgi:hypothetical protein